MKKIDVAIAKIQAITQVGENEIILFANNNARILNDTILETESGDHLIPLGFTHKKDGNINVSSITVKNPENVKAGDEITFYN